MRGVPQGSVLGPPLFLLYVSKISSILKNFTSLFADDTKLHTFLLEPHDDSTLYEDQPHTTNSLQHDLNRVTTWSEIYQMSFNLSKCHVLHLGHNNPKQTYTMFKSQNWKQSKNGVSYDLKFYQLETVKEEKDLGVVVDDELKFSKHVDTKVSKANKLLGLIKHTFKHLTPDILKSLYNTLIRPHLEYATPVWSPHLKGDRDKIEKVQRRATKLVPELRNRTYEERLKHLNLATLEFRRLRTDLILLYKYSHNLIKLDPNTYCPQCKHNTSMLQPSLTRSSRGHNLKFQIHHHSGIRNRFLTSRVLPTWNKLLPETVNAPSINAFKSKLLKDKNVPDQFEYLF